MRLGLSGVVEAMCRPRNLTLLVDWRVDSILLRGGVLPRIWVMVEKLAVA